MAIAATKGTRMPGVGLADALRVVVLMAPRERDRRFDRAARSWWRGLTLDDVDEALAALERLPQHPADALATLRGLLVHLHVPDAERLAEK